MKPSPPAIRPIPSMVRAFPPIAVLAALLVVGAASPGAFGDEDEAPVFPRTFESIWFRSDTHGEFKGGRLKGDLTLTRDGLLFASPKREVVLPYESIHVIGLGKMRGDVDTDWVVLAIDRDGRRERVGIRDGNRWGYGGKTPAIYRVIRDALELFGQAQFRAPQEFKAYTELDAQVSFAIPDNWTVVHLELVDVEGWPRWGAFVVRPERDPEPDPIDHELELRSLREGGAGAWIVERRAAGDGMNCEGFSRAGIRRLRETIAASAYFGSGIAPDALGEGEPVVLDECRGMKFRLPAGNGIAEEREIWIASDGDTIFFIGTGVPNEDAAEHLARFRSAIEHVRFSPARSPAG